LEFELALFLAKNRDSDDVCREQVTRKLDAAKAQTQDAGKRFSEHGFAESWKIFDQEVAPGQKARQGKGYLIVFAKDDIAERFLRFDQHRPVSLFVDRRLFQSIVALHARLLGELGQFLELLI
jgi:hypothetical protein